MSIEDDLVELLKEKDAMIDWLADQLLYKCDNPFICNICFNFLLITNNCDKCYNNNRKEAAQKAVKKND